MSNFLQAYSAVLDYANRPSSELLVQAKREVNAAVQWVTMHHQFLYAETTALIDYTANAHSISLAGLTDKVQFIKAVDIVKDENSLFGDPIKVVAFEAIKSAYYKHKMRTPYAGDLEDEHDEDTFEGYMDCVRSTDRKLGFFLGEQLGLFPTPKAQLKLRLYYVKKLPIMTDNSETNFLLNHCFDFIVVKALSRFNYYLKEDEAFQVDTENLTRDWEAVKSWDAQLRSSYGVSLGSEM